MRYQVDFDSLPWESAMPGVRHKIMVSGDRRLRLVEFADDMPPHWCERGHIGQILEGRLQVEIAGETLVYRRGDGVILPSGPAHAHRATALTPVVVALFVEDA